jgi:hypothetical protein
MINVNVLLFSCSNFKYCRDHLFKYSSILDVFFTHPTGTKPEYYNIAID